MTHIERQLLKYIEDINSGKSGGIPVSPNRINEVLKNEAQKFIDILSQLIPYKSSGEKIFDAGLIQTTTEIIDGVGYIHINFPHEDAHRDSWYPEKYDKGADIIILFNNGYDAKHHVIDKSSGRILKLDSNKGDNSELGESSYRVSLTHRDPLRFVQEAIDKYNSKSNSNINAEYNEELYT